jgi:hypothetical protein
LREREDIDAVLEIAGVVREPRAAESGLVEGQLMNHRAHRAIEDGDAFGEHGTEEVTTVVGWHLSFARGGNRDP